MSMTPNGSIQRSLRSWVRLGANEEANHGPWFRPGSISEIVTLSQSSSGFGRRAVQKSRSSPLGSNFCLLRNFQRIIQLDTQVLNGTFQLRMTE